MDKRPLVAAAVIIVMLAASILYYKYRVPPTLQLEKLELYRLDGRRFEAGNFKGKKVFVNFFATWCGPCLNEMPALEDAASLLEKENFVFVCISDEPIQRLAQFNEGINGPIIILHSAKPLRDSRIYTFPTSYVLNEANEIILKKTGAIELTGAELAEKLRRMR
jgi:thiol-disulfide isomerase/thioredoxin